jgi:hypothetical protein
LYLVVLETNQIPNFPIAFGAAYGTAKSGVGLCAMGVMRPELMMKNIIPIVMVCQKKNNPTNQVDRLVLLVFME